MSRREEIQEELVQFIMARDYTAPYGVLDSIQSVGRGKVRSITFGVARTLDAEILIWSEKRFTVRAQGALSRFFAREYYDVEILKRDINLAVGGRLSGY